MKDIDIIIAIIVTTLIIIVLISIVIISIFIGRQDRIKQQMKLSEAHLNYEKELRKVEMEISENIMEQFSQELHDNIGHILTAMRITIENKKIDHPELTPILQSIETYLNEATQQIRLLSRLLNKDYVNNQGLINSIQIETERLLQLNRFQVHIQNDVQATNLNKNQELIVFRIFQEIVHNSIKHSKAANLVIRLNNTDGFMLQVNDDGQGFNLDEILQSPKASGLKNIIKRANMAEMDCIIESVPGSGCKYILQQQLAAISGN